MRSIFIPLILFSLVSKAVDPLKTPSFKENKGQVCDQFHNSRPDVLFSGTNGNMVYHLKTKGISYQLNNSQLIYRVDVNWLNSNSDLEIVKGKALSGEENYYTNGRSLQGIKSYDQIIYKEIYNGIDLKWYQKNGNLEYDYEVKAGADHKQIHLEFKGAERISLNKKGELILKTALGEIIEQAPLVYQDNKMLPAKWKIENNIVSFDIRNIDPSQSFVIDPTVAVRLWGTYYGGSGDEIANATCTDASGNVFIAGVTTSSIGTSIATSGASQTIFGTGTNDAFLAKLDANGNRLWATYYGDAGDETAFSCATDASGNVFMSGITGSSGGTAIASAVCHQNVFGGGSYDCFLVKFDANGLRLWGTYYGGIADDFGQSVCTDASGNVYMAGITSSGTGTVIATVGSHQALKAAANDGFLVKFDAAGIRQWGTYYGGSGPDNAYSCAVDLSGNVYIAGSSSSSGGTVIATATSHQPLKSAGNDAYLVKFNSSGVRQWATFYGGGGSDIGYSCITDAFGFVYLNGSTSSSGGTIIATAAAHQNTYAGGSSDAFLTKFDAAGIRQWGTYYGGTGNESGSTGVATDAPGNVYIAGTSASTLTSVIATALSYQDTYGGGNNDAYLVKFDSSGVRLWGTYYGGAGDDKGFSCSRNNSGNVFLCGNSSTSSGTMVANSSSHQNNFGGGLNDAFLVKFSDCTLPTSPNNTSLLLNLNICSGNTTTLSATATGTVNWFLSASGGTVLASGNNFITTLSVTTTFYAENFSCAPSATRTAITVSVSPCIGIHEVGISSAQLSVYPNPSKGEFFISSEFNIELSIVNELGQTFKTIQLNERNDHKILISDLHSGIYFIVGRNDREVVRQKVIVTK